MGAPAILAVLYAAVLPIEKKHQDLLLPRGMKDQFPP